MPWSVGNFSRLFRATGERPARVAELKDMFIALANNFPGPLVPGGVFDHGELWGRDRTPTTVVGHPYQISLMNRALLADLARRYPTLRVCVDDRPGYYGFDTHHVRIELVDVHRPFRTPRATRKTREAARRAREAFAEAFSRGDPDS
jgi:hypothetical protein